MCVYMFIIYDYLWKNISYIKSSNKLCKEDRYTCKLVNNYKC